jgi:hypothetical protein
LVSWQTDTTRRRRFDRAYRKLEGEEMDSPEATLLLAIAAEATSHRDTLAAAIKSARRKGIDVSLLQPTALPARSAGR